MRCIFETADLSNGKFWLRILWYDRYMFEDAYIVLKWIEEELKKDCIKDGISGNDIKGAAIFKFSEEDAVAFKLRWG